MLYRIINKMNILFAIFIFMSFVTLQAQEDSWDKIRSSEKSSENLSEDLAGRLKLSDAQKSQLKDIMSNFQESFSMKSDDTPRSEAERAAEQADKETRRDHTRVEGETDNATGTSTGNAQTKRQSQDEMGSSTGTKTSAVFERARTEADGRIEEMLSPDQALEYGKIKSDWWDKVKETVQPSSEKSNGAINNNEEMEGINQIDSTRK